MAFGRAASYITLVAHVLQILVRAPFPFPQTPFPLLVGEGPGRLLDDVAPVLRERPGPREAEGAVSGGAGAMEQPGPREQSGSNRPPAPGAAAASRAISTAIRVIIAARRRPRPNPWCLGCPAGLAAAPNGCHARRVECAPGALTRRSAASKLPSGLRQRVPAAIPLRVEA